MCGIVGYIGNQEAAEILLEGLKRLEYRGYDSAGLALLDGKITLRREVGKIRNLVRDILLNPVTGTIGIGHTRWATHGRPTQDNAHPHTDCGRSLAVVHNGIIENYLALKTDLLAHGHTFRSDTDTEVLAHLIETTYRGDLARAVYEALGRLKGTYAIVVLHRDHPEELVAARYGSPLVVGLGEGETFVASDIPAILPHTRRIIFLEEKDLARVTREGAFLFDSRFRPVERRETPVDWTLLAAEKGDYPHFMLKEIWEQPQALVQALGGRLNDTGGGFYLEEVNLSREDLLRIQRVGIVACGTSYYAGLIGEYFLESVCGIPTKVELASEFRYRKPVVDDRTLIIAISQSGETADTLAAVREAQAHGATVVGIVNATGSALSRTADSTLYLHAGPEIGVASTKAFTSTIAVLQMLALHLGLSLGKLSTEQVLPLIAELRQLPQLVERTLNLAEAVRELASCYVSFTNFLYLGRGLNYPIALEGALKLKELSYIHAEGLAAGEIKHGPIALIDPDMPVIALATQSSTYDKLLSNLQEVKARYGRLIALVSEGDEEVFRHVDDVLIVPRVSEWLSAVVNVIPLQLFAYYVALLRHCDVDQPRNLAKSVTVE